jgi:tRNA nucleotidyltransferase (CCA-adding enzyme)
MATGDSPIVVQVDDPECRERCEAVCRAVREAGGRALLVGGCVRDCALGRPATDFDIEVYGIPAVRLVELLSRRFALDLVGRAFGVIKLRGLPIDVSIPRRSSRSGRGPEGFETASDPDLTPAEAAGRRDFTINAIAVDPLTGEVIDPFSGREDLEARILRHTTDRFADDPLRVLRGMQLAARFDLDVAAQTIALCREIDPGSLAPERVFAEWKKLVLRGQHPSRGLAFLRDCGWIRCFPELEALIGCEQEPEWHPEGDVWTHTLHCMDSFASERSGDERDDLVVGMAVLCHDLGKPSTTTEEEDGRITSKRHGPAGETRTRSFLGRMTRERTLIDEVAALVGAHLAPTQLFEARAGDAAVRRLARRVGRIDRLVRVARADRAGRPPLEAERFDAGNWLLERARALAVEATAPERIVKGRHLIPLGVNPGPQLGSILETCYTAQLEGEFSTLEEGLEYVRERLGVGPDRRAEPH